jgi:tetratricopeptide (TPR) repeat protein
MPVTTTRLRGVHPRLAFPPPPRRPSLAVWSHVDGLDERLAWALFLVLRRARDAAEFPPFAAGRWKHARDARAAAARAPEIGDPLLLLGTGTSLRARSRADVARACHRLAKWAGRGGYAEFAIQFAEAAAALQPANAGRVFEAARMHRMFGNPGDAAVYYGRAICLGRKPGAGPAGVELERSSRSKGWHVYVRAHLGMGKLCEATGDRARAAAHYTTAAQAAWKNTGEKWLAARTQHQMVSLMAESGQFEAAYQHALKAYAWMPKHNALVPALVHDYALLLVRMHAYETAMPLLEKAVGALPPLDQVIGWSTLGRAAGALQDEKRFREAERMVHVLEPRFALHAAAAHVNLGIGARALGSFSSAEQHALRAVELAKARGLRAILADAETLLAETRQQTTAPTAAGDLPLHLRRLARDLAKRLAEWRGPARAGARGLKRDRVGAV